MATSIGGLTINLTGSAVEFERMLDKASFSLKSFSSLAKTVFGGLVAGFSLKAFGDAIQSSLDRMDALSKSAEKVGITTEALSRLGYAASLADVSSEDLTHALGVLNRTLGDAVADGGEAAKGFERLGLSAETLAKLPLETALGQIADRMNALPSASQRASIGADIFKKSWMGVSTLMKEGSAGLKALADESDAAGATVSTADGKMAEATNDSVTRMSKAWDGFTNQLAMNFGPSIAASADAVSESMRDPEGLFNLNFFLDKRGKEIAHLTDLWVVFRDTMTSTPMELGMGAPQWPAFGEGPFSQMREMMKNPLVAKPMAEIAVEMDKTAAAAEQIAQSWATLTEQGMKVEQDFAAPMDVYVSRMAELSDLLDQGAISWGAFDRAAEKALETLDKFDVAAETAKIQATIASPFQKFAHEMSAVNKLFARGAITQSIVDQARTHFVDEIFNKNDQLSKSEQRGTPALAMGSVEFGKALQQAQKDVLIGDDDAKKISEKQLRELEKISEAVAHFAIARF